MKAMTIADHDWRQPDPALEWEQKRDYERDLARWREHRRKYPIRTASEKERPSCRRTIIRFRLRPYPALCAWDGFTAFDSNGHQTFLSEGLKAQMRKMILEGYWNDGVRP